MIKSFVWLGNIMIMLFAQAVLAKENIYAVDGDSIKLREQNVRLAYIDAPEYYQTCKDSEGKEYNCGIKAREKLERLMKLGELSCKTIGKDIYNRDMSECFVGNVNVNLEMVKSGWAVVYKSTDVAYLDAQKDAKRAKLGIWQGKYMKPELYRILFK